MRPPDKTRSAILKAMEPVDDVPLEELVGGVQPNLVAGHGGVHPYQVHGVLKLVAETVCPAGLIKSTTGPDALGKSLIFQPVQVAIELGPVGLNLKRGHKSEPPLLGYCKAAVV